MGENDKNAKNNFVGFHARKSTTITKRGPTFE
jgi:hypothetical protein